MAFNSLIRTTLQRFTTAPRVLCSLPPPLGLQAVTPPPSGLLGLVSRLCFSTSNAFANVRNHFPRPNERRRVNRHGWNKRMSTLAGRKILMKRILKGRHVLSH